MPALRRIRRSALPADLCGALGGLVSSGVISRLKASL